MSLITDSEMQALTGAIKPSKQIENLRNNGIRFTVKADGRPTLTWESYNQQLGNPSTTSGPLVGNETTLKFPNLKAV